MEEIQSKATLASIVCNNCDQPSPIQRYEFNCFVLYFLIYCPIYRRAFLMFDDVKNPLIPCSKHPKLNLELWKEELPTIGRQERKLKNPNVQKSYCDFQGRVVLPGQSLKVSACVTCTCRTDKVKANSKRDSGDEFYNQFGSDCHSVRVNSCSNLENEVGRDAMLADQICMKQCK